MGNKPDFVGYATKNDLKCSDGVTIRRGAFSDDNGKRVPLVWQHFHDDPAFVIGHADLEENQNGIIARAAFNGNDMAKDAKEAVRHGDITRMSIFANHIRKVGTDIVKGSIKEVSLVISGANPGATIENVYIEHSDSALEPIQDEVIIHSGETIILDYEEEEPTSDIKHSDEKDSDITVESVINSMNDNQKKVMYGMVEAALKYNGELEQSDINENKGGDLVGEAIKKTGARHNIFEKSAESNSDVIKHDDLYAAFEQAKNNKSEHAWEDAMEIAHAKDYGITNIELLFPEAKSLSTEPVLISRDMAWVGSVLDAAKKTAFSRIKSFFADITADEARAKGYITGNKKTDEKFSLLTRTTMPQTVYKRQKFDRDDLIDITWDIWPFVKREMSIMLREELARAMLIGDGRAIDSPDKIKEDCIRPIALDDDLYSISVNVPSTIKSDEFIDLFIQSMDNYEGSGNITLFMARPELTKMLLIKDNNGRRIYNGVSDVAAALGISKIVTVPLMKGVTKIKSDDSTVGIKAIAVDMSDYTIGCDRGGEMRSFSQFDIDFNQEKFLMETRLSASLIKPKSAIIFETPTSNG